MIVRIKEFHSASTSMRRISLIALFVMSSSSAALADDKIFGTDNADTSTNFGGKYDWNKLDTDRQLDRDRKFDYARPRRVEKVDKLGTVDMNNMPDRNDPFDGSEFSVSPFKEMNFSKSPFVELFQAKADKSDDRRDKKDKKGATDDDDLSRVEDDRKRREAEDRDDFKDFIRPVYFLPGDWSPSGLDPVWNGGFTTPPDNGSPVPYRLDGHVDLQRGLPWSDDH